MISILRIICLLFFSFQIVKAQINNNEFIWSANKKLTVDDFYIKTKNSETSTSFAQFSFEYQINGFNFLTKNFNKKVRNCMLRNASWIDTTYSIPQSILYQQTLFDIAEIYARKFRKSLKESKKQIIKGVDITNRINQSIMSEFSKRRIEYDRQTNSGTIIEKQKEWEELIKKELEELSNFDYNK